MFKLTVWEGDEYYYLYSESEYDALLEKAYLEDGGYEVEIDSDEEMLLWEI